jgi:hypothetical protein
MSVKQAAAASRSSGRAQLGSRALDSGLASYVFPPSKFAC